MLEFETMPVEIGRQVISIRAQPSLKHQLLQEATVVGITLSEHCENIISTRSKMQKDLDEMRLCNIEKQKEIDQLKLQLTDKPSVNSQSISLIDERLLFLFENLKGKSDTIENAYGDDFSIIYKEPRDVLKGIIYSIKLKK